MVSHLDIFPTICELAGIEAPDWLRGKSLLPLVCDDAVADIHEELFFEVNYHAAYEPMRAVRTRRWKYIRRFEDRTRPVLCNCDAGESKDVWLDAGWCEQEVKHEALFDLTFDPNEMNNLVSDAGAQTVLHDMRDRLQRWMVATDDPLLRGPVATPEGALVNDVDDVSPSQKKR